TQPGFFTCRQSSRFSHDLCRKRRLSRRQRYGEVNGYENFQNEPIAVPSDFRWTLCASVSLWLVFSVLRGMTSLASDTPCSENPLHGRSCTRACSTWHFGLSGGQ